VVQDRPKVLAEIAGRPFLTYLLDQLIKVNIGEVVLCTGYRSNQIRDTLGDRYQGLGITYSVETFPLGTAGALRLALPLFRSDPVLVMNGDSYCDAEFGSFSQWHWRRQAVTSLLLTKVDDTQRFGRVQVAENGTVAAFQEKGASAGPGLISAGIYLMSRNLITSIPGGTPVSLEHEVFPRWVGHGLYGFETESRFMDIGTPDAFAGAGSFFAGLAR
jgi:D-glycero-alpha-D-manno-heptose 1-phosphate guanylyltransferase